jgi:hypothetical protein
LAFFEIEDDSELWNMAIALDWYSNFDRMRLRNVRTELGQAVHEYKYYKNLSDERRQQIVRTCSAEIGRVLKLQFEVEKESFNSCIAVIPNSDLGHSLPLDLALQLSYQFDWIRDDSRCLIKTRDLEPLKNKSRESRAGYIAGAYAINEEYRMTTPRGFLLIDDVYETGSTLREICRTLNRTFPSVPRYVLAITRKRVPTVWKMGS